jgi:hypothetical protein
MRDRFRDARGASKGAVTRGRLENFRILSACGPRDED